MNSQIPEPTYEQRLMIYEYALYQVWYIQVGMSMCRAIRTGYYKFTDIEREVGFNEICHFFPELMAQKPKKQYDALSWFNPNSIWGYWKRKRILKKCIKQVKNEQRKQNI